MRILAVHNYYGSSSPSGENQVFESEAALLRRRGAEVIEFVRSSDEIRAAGALGTLRGALSTPWNPYAASKIKREVGERRPDVVHVHNTFPLISPSIFSAVQTAAATVLTLHNYRLFCPAAIPLRRGSVCTECLDRRSVWPSLVHGCYRDSRIATVPLATSVSLHRHLGTWSKHVDAFIALSEFQKELMIEAGLPSEKVHVKPNFYPGNPTVLDWSQREPYVVFAGRLTPEKGVLTLIESWKAWGHSAPELRIVGDGPLRPQLQEMARGLRVSFLGRLPAHAAESQIAGSRLLVLPSECFEGFPMVIREAFAFGTPVAVSRLGALPSIVRDGFSGVLFEPRDAPSLRRAIQTVWSDTAMLMKLGSNARWEFDNLYNEERNYRALMAIYADAMDRFSRRAR